MIRIDRLVFPQWTLKWMYFDFNNYSYICTLVAYNNHNHPILITFLTSLEDKSNAIKKILAEKEQIKIENKEKFLDDIRNAKDSSFRDAY